MKKRRLELTNSSQIQRFQYVSAVIWKQSLLGLGLGLCFSEELGLGFSKGLGLGLGLVNETKKSKLEGYILVIIKGVRQEKEKVMIEAFTPNFKSSVCLRIYLENKANLVRTITCLTS